MLNMCYQSILGEKTLKNMIQGDFGLRKLSQCNKAMGLAFVVKSKDLDAWGRGV